MNTNETVQCTQRGCYELTDDATCLCQSCRDFIFDKIRGVSTTIRPVESKPAKLWRLMYKIDDYHCLTTMGVMSKEEFQEVVDRL